MQNCERETQQGRRPFEKQSFFASREIGGIFAVSQNE